MHRLISFYSCPFCNTHRNPSNGSGFSDTGSMERPKIATTGSAAAAAASAAAADKRKKSEEASASKESRIDARQVIDDLIKSANLEHDENAEGTIQYNIFTTL